MAQTTSGHLKRYELKTFPNDTELARTVADLWLDEVEKIPSQKIALSGGTIARLFFREIAERAVIRKTPLTEVDFFWADERCVLPGDPESNFLLANENLFLPLGISAEKIHHLRGELEPAEAVAKANSEILKTVRQRNNGQPMLDIVFLGVGPDGHVASLFSNASARVLNCAKPFLSIENSPKPPPKRITLSYAAIATAKEVWVLISGSGKENVLRESLSETGNTPLARVLQSRQQTKIFTDVKFQ
jgi:6-phosphogluconolactonase